MNLLDNIVITDTNIITDLFTASLLEKFIWLDSVFVVDLLAYDEFNEKTGNIEQISKIKLINANSNDVVNALNISAIQNKLSFYDSINFVLAKRLNAVLATGDKRLGIFATENGVQVIRTLKIIELMYEYKLILLNEMVSGLIKLLNDSYTRIPRNEILKLINKYIKYP